MRHRKPAWSYAACLVLGAALAFSAPFGCGGGSGPTVAEEPTAGDAGSSGEGGGARADGGDTTEIDAGAVFMCGRSVLAGWFEHWGWVYDPEETVRFGSHLLSYREMYSPPDIVDSAVGAAREASREGVDAMFFKLCFVDFAGGDEYGARENLEENMRIVRDVARAAVDEGGLTLILGNALPMVRGHTDEWLVWNHRQYNRYLEGLAEEYGGRVVILDLYGTLAAADGWLRPEYAADPGDSHLSRAAYRALDEELARVLGGSP